MTAELIVRRKFNALKGSIDERIRRLWAGAEAEAIGYGGIAKVSRATGRQPTEQRARNRGSSVCFMAVAVKWMHAKFENRT